MSDLTIETGYLPPEAEAIHAQYQSTDPDAPYYDPEPVAVEHNHRGADWQCEALADVLRARMRWPSLHWGRLHDDAFSSLARAVHEAGYELTSRPGAERS